MKIAIALISVVLIFAVFTSVAPILSGGLDFSTEEEATVAINGTDLEIKGKYIITSNMDNQIRGLKAQVYTYLSDTNDELLLVSQGPYTLNKGDTVTIDINEKISLVEIAMYILAENSGSEEDGLYLPLKIQFGGEFVNIAGLDMSMNLKIKISENGKISNFDIVKTPENEVKSVGCTLEGYSFGTDIDASLSVEGIPSLKLKVENDGANTKIKVESDGTKSIKQLFKEIVDSGENGKLEFGGTTQELTHEELESLYSAVVVYLDKLAELNL